MKTIRPSVRVARLLVFAIGASVVSSPARGSETPIRASSRLVGGQAVLTFEAPPGFGLRAWRSPDLVDWVVEAETIENVVELRPSRESTGPAAFFRAELLEEPIRGRVVPQLTEDPEAGVLLTWTPIPGALEYLVHRSANFGPFESLGRAPWHGRQYLDAGVIPGLFYRYAMTARNSSNSTELTQTLAPSVLALGGPPVPPGGLTAEVLPLYTFGLAAGIRYRWEDRSTNEVHFVVETSEDGRTWSIAGIAGADAREFTSFEAAWGGRFYARVGAWSLLDAAAYSEPLQVELPPSAVPAVVSVVPAEAAPGESVRLQGEHFDPEPGGNRVRFGPATALVTTASATELTVTVPPGAGEAPLTLTARGRVAYSSAAFRPKAVASGPLEASQFRSRFDLPIAAGTADLVAVDVNTDGLTDLVLAQPRERALTIFVNSAPTGGLTAGSWSAPFTVPTPVAPRALAAGDLDGDGGVDLVVVGETGGRMAVLRNVTLPKASTPIFVQREVETDADALTDVVVHDLDADGRPDLVVSRADARRPGLGVLENQSSAHGPAFGGEWYLPTVDPAGEVVVADLDLDGRPDLVTTGRSAGSLAIFRNLVAVPGLGSGSFSEAITVPGGAFPEGLLASDVEGDGRPDLVVASGSDGAISVVRNGSGRGFVDPEGFVLVPVAASARRPATTDLDGDGRPECVGSTAVGLAVLRNVSIPEGATNLFETGFALEPPGRPDRVLVTDLDRDGRPEVVVIEPEAGLVSVFRNRDPNGPVNEPPSLSTVADVEVEPGDPTVEVTFTVNDRETPPSELRVTLASDRPDWFGEGRLVLTGSNQVRGLRITVPTEGAGLARIRLTVGDSVGDEATTAFYVVLQPKGTRSLLAVRRFQPARNGHVGAVPDALTLVFNQALASTGPSSRSVVVRPTQTAVPSDAAWVPNVDGDTLRVALPFTLQPGEPVAVTVLSDLVSASGAESKGPTVYGFRVGVAGGTGFFHPSAGYEANPSGSVAVGDLDGDGFNDLLIGTNVFFNDGVGRFARSPYPAGTNLPRQTVLGDLDGDGSLDAILAGSPESQVWTNNGRGRLIDTGQRIAGINRRSVALGDLDGDGALDALFGNELGSIQVHINDRRGRFAARGALPEEGSHYTHGVALGDVDQDGDLDAVAADARGAGSLFFNDGTGSFTRSAQSLSTDSHVVVLGDLNGDGFLDLVFGGSSSASMEVWINDGRGTYARRDSPFGLDQSWSLDLGDVDADGDLDLASTGVNGFVGYSQPTTVWLNDGTGRFTFTRQPLTTWAAPSVRLAELDGDGVLDVVTANSIWLGGNAVPTISVVPDLVLRKGTVSEPIAFDVNDAETPAAELRVAAWSSNEAVLASEAVRLSTGESRRSFTLHPEPGVVGGTIVTLTVTDSLGGRRETSFKVTIREATDLLSVVSIRPAPGSLDSPSGTPVVVDFDGPLAESGAGQAMIFRSFQSVRETGTVAAVSADGRRLSLAPVPRLFPGERLDVTLTTRATGADGRPPAGPRHWSYRAATVGGSGRFLRSPFALSPAGNGTIGYRMEVVAGDLDGDGHADLLELFGGPGSYPSRLWRNDGTGRFGGPVPAFTTFMASTARLADLDGNGSLDVVVVARPGLSVWLNTGDSFVPGPPVAVAVAGGGQLEVGDLDGDGDVDVLAVGGSIRVCFNAGDGTLVAGPVFAEAVSRVARIDADGDGDADVIAAERDGFRIWRNDGAGGFVAAPEVFGPASVGNGSVEARSGLIAVGDFDGDGSHDAVLGREYGSGRIWHNDGRGFFSAGRTELGEGGGMVDLVEGDFDADGRLDLLVVSVVEVLGGAPINRVWINRGDGEMAAVDQGLGPAIPGGAVTGDLDGDGALDLVFASQDDSEGLIWLGAPSPPAITSPNPLPDGRVGGRYRVMLTVTGGRSPHVWSVVAGNLPTGLGLNAAMGLIEGTPTQAGTFGFRLRVTDATGDSSDAFTSMTVLGP